MSESKLKTMGSKTICQIAIVVRDIEKTARAWADLFGVAVPEWRLTGPGDETNTRYRGQPSSARAKLAFIQFDNISLELIEPVGAPSVWQEVLDAKGECVHHVAFRVKGADEHVAMLDAKGMPLIQSGDYTGGCYRYIDSAGTLGVILELLENR